MHLTLQSWREAGSTFRHRGQSVFYRSSGHGRRGPTLLCIHGLPTASWDWVRLWPRLHESFARVLAPDLVGFGFSDKPEHYPYSIFDQADLLEALLRAEGVTHYRVLAHDYGVTVAQELLARHDERQARGDHTLVLQRVCFLNGGLFPESHRPLLVQRLMLTRLGPWLSRASTESTFRRNFSRIFGLETKPSAQELAEFWQLVTVHGGRRSLYKLFHYMPERVLHRERWVSALQKTAVPLRLVNGAADPISGAHMVERYRELVKSPDTVLLPGIGHYPHVEAPEAVWEASKTLLVGE